MSDVKTSLAAAARLLSTMAEGDVYGVEPAAVAVEVEHLDDLGALLITAVNDAAAVEGEVERLRRELSMADVALRLSAQGVERSRPGRASEVVAIAPPDLDLPDGIVELPDDADHVRIDNRTPHALLVAEFVVGDRRTIVISEGDGDA